MSLLLSLAAAALMALPAHAQSGCYPGLPCPTTAPPPAAVPPPATPEPEPEADSNLTRADLEGVLSDYLSAWRSGDINSQSDLLSADFYSADERGKPAGYQDRAAYLAQKQRLSRDNDWIEIKTRSPEYRVQGSTGTISYRQLYNNSRYCSLGTNKFLVRKEDGAARIYREVFTADRRIPKPNAPAKDCPAGPL